MKLINAIGYDGEPLWIIPDKIMAFRAGDNGTTELEMQCGQASEKWIVKTQLNDLLNHFAFSK